MPGYDEATLKSQEEELRLFLQSVEEQIEKLQQLKEKLLEKRDEIKEELQKHELAVVPVRLASSEAEDLLASVEDHLMELNKLRAYLNSKLKKVIEEEKALELLKGKFPGSIEVKQHDHSFEIVYKSNDTENAFEFLKKSKEKISGIKDALRKMEFQEPKLNE